MSGYEKGLDSVINNIRATNERNKAMILTASMEVGASLLNGVREQATLTNISTEELTAMGHPYSTRKPINSGPDPDNEVHLQSGILNENIEMDMTAGNLIKIRVGVDESKVPYIGDLINGSETMRKRDFLEGAMDKQRSSLTSPLRSLFK